MKYVGVLVTVFVDGFVAVTVLVVFTVNVGWSDTVVAFVVVPVEDLE